MRNRAWLLVEGFFFYVMLEEGKNRFPSRSYEYGSCVGMIFVHNLLAKDQKMQGVFGYVGCCL